MKHFGTDGIRAFNEDFTPEYLEKIALGIASLGNDMTVVLGRDTRQSGLYIESELTKTLNKYGVNVISAGMVPTPVLSFLAKKLGCDYGIMLSASHNPPEYNGIKLFAKNGGKVSEKVELDIEEVIENPRFPKERRGKQSYYDGTNDYIDYVVGKIKPDLKGVKIMLDTANGAASIVAPEMFLRAGAEIVQLKGETDGLRINENCGATCPRFLLEEMKKSACDIGFTYDGDGDRVMCVYKGKIYNGDHLMYVHCRTKILDGTLVENVMVGTIMSNLGTEIACKNHGINLVRANVGDKHVYRIMTEKGYNVGGEESGHIIFSDYHCTGDGLIASLLTAKLNKRIPINELDDIVECPSVTEGIICGKENIKRFNESQEIKQFLSDIDKEYRIVVRASGTEPKIRILVEHMEMEKALGLAKEIKNFIKERIL